jgi:DNA-binding NarL/FixJ family response regulator
MPEIKIIIADDHPIFRAGLKAVIERERDLLVVGEADDGAAALDQIKVHGPDIVIADLDMPAMDGFELARTVRDASLPVKVVVLSMHKDEMHFSKAIDCGVSGYVIKDEASAELVGCIRSVVAGREYFSPVLSSFLLKRSQRASAFSQQGGIDDLTPAEKQVLRLLAELRTSREIAEVLGVSTRTVENHRAHICSKLDLQGSHALTRFAVQHTSELS